MKIGNKTIGNNNPIYIIAEIGLNHNGDLSLAKKLIDIACDSKVDAVKFQKRTPDLVVPKDQRNVKRDTPWGRMTYMDYRYKVEFEFEQYKEIDRYCKEKNIDWFASPWAKKSVEFLEQFNPVCYKIPSACATDLELISYIISKKRPIIISTGMCTQKQIDDSVAKLINSEYAVLHCTSTYPTKAEEVNLAMIKTLKDLYDCPIGYSGHEAGLQISLAAAALGAAMIERHITLDRTMWGSDQAASLEPWGLEKLVRDIRIIEDAIGDGLKKVYDSEIPIMNKLRIRL